MSLTAEEIREIATEITAKGGVFSSRIPTTAEDMLKFISNEKGRQEVKDLLDAHAENTHKIGDILKISEFISEVIYPALVMEKSVAALKLDPNKLQTSPERSNAPPFPVHRTAPRTL